MQPLDQLLFNYVGIAIPWIQGSMISLTLIITLLGVIVKLTKTKKDDKALAFFKGLISQAQSGASVEQIVKLVKKELVNEKTDAD